MTKLLTVLCCIIGVSGILAAPFAQSAHKGQKPMMAKIYACEKCEMASAKAGKCAGCHMAMKPINGKRVYACGHCHTTSDKMGKCSKCGMEMKKMAMTYACEKCHTTSAKAGKCSMCKGVMKQHIMKMG
jgi:hypothetical protein